MDPVVSDPVDLYGDHSSGNCVKALLAAEASGAVYRWHLIDTSIPGTPRDPRVVALNPSGQVPALGLPDGRGIGQSNAIVLYLLRDTDLVPDDPFAHAKMLEWMFWEQYSHEPYVAVVRASVVYRGVAIADRDPDRVARAEAALDTMERHLAEHDWFAGDHASAADIALYPYTRLAHQGGFDLSDRSAITRWIDRCERRFASGIEAWKRLGREADGKDPIA